MLREAVLSLDQVLCLAMAARAALQASAPRSPPHFQAIMRHLAELGGHAPHTHQRLSGKVPLAPSTLNPRAGDHAQPGAPATGQDAPPAAVHQTPLKPESRTLRWSASGPQTGAQVITRNLERVRRVKTRHQRLSTRVATVRDELQRFLEDDDDMAKMCLSRKAAVAKAQAGQPGRPLLHSLLAGAVTDGRHVAD